MKFEVLSLENLMKTNNEGITVVVKTKINRKFVIETPNFSPIDSSAKKHNWR